MSDKPNGKSPADRLLRHFTRYESRPHNGYWSRPGSNKGKTVYQICSDGKVRSGIIVTRNTRLAFTTEPVWLAKGLELESVGKDDWPGGWVHVDDANFDACDKTLVRHVKGKPVTAVKSQGRRSKRPPPPEVIERRGVRNVPVEFAASEGYEYWERERKVEAIRREAALVRAFLAYLQSREREAIGRLIWTGAGGDPIKWDVYDTRRHILFEAKADSSDRSQLRMAIGQLFDYAYFGFGDEERARLRLAILFPGRPPRDFEELLSTLGIGMAWPIDDGFVEAFPDVKPACQVPPRLGRGRSR